MAQYADHLRQVRSNLEFLKRINSHCNDYLDWQVTTCFYVGVPLINGFIAREANLHFNSHEKVKDAISPFSKIDKTKLDDETYLAYAKLRNLSRRSRYLCSSGENPNDELHRAHYTLERHFTKAFKNLDKLLKYFYSKYGDAYAVTPITYAFETAIPNCTYFKFSKTSTLAS